MATERIAVCPECQAERTTRANAGVPLTCSNGHKYKAPVIEPPAAPAATNGGVPVKRASKVKIRPQARPHLQDSSGGVTVQDRPSASGPPAAPEAVVPASPVPTEPAPVLPSPAPAPSSDPSPADPLPAPPVADDPDAKGQRNGRKGGLGRYRELVGARRS